MLKRIIACVLVMAMALSVTTAFAWSCPSCGTQAQSKFCPECGTKKPENICPGCGFNHGDKALKFCTECGTKMDAVPAAATPVPESQGPVLSETFENENGTISLMWDADGETEYTIEIILCQSDDPLADRNANNNYSASRGRSKIGFYTISKLIPGRSYWIGLFDEEGRGGYTLFTPLQQPEAFSAFSLQLLCNPMIVEDGKQVKAASFAAGDIADGEPAGLYLVLDYDNPGDSCPFVIQIAFTAPNEAAWATYSTGEFKQAHKNKVGWEFLDLEGYFDRLENCFGEVPAGEYKVDVYVNGELAGSAAFDVTTDDAIQVKMSDNEDGTVNLTWDGGVAPYHVYYHLRFSDDSAADRTHPLVPTCWIAEKDVAGNALVLEHLIPGRNYWVTLEDSTGTETIVPYTAGTVVKSDLNMTVTSYPRKEKEEQITDLTAFSAAEINQADGTDFGLYIDLDYNQLPEDCQKASKWILTLPDGVKFCEYAFDMNMYASGSTYWEMYDLGWAFGKVMEWYDGMLQGEYKFDLYVEGKHACSLTFTVGE